MRKITQFAAVVEITGRCVIIGLCNDGTLWTKTLGKDWEPVQQVPQTPVPTTNLK